jgi:hypothetical protein
LQSKRVIGCTTTGAAQYHELLEDAKATVVIVEEAWRRTACSAN